MEEVGEFIATMDKLLYRSIAASILQSGLSVSDLLALRYGDVKEEFEKGIAPLCLSLTRKKTGISFITFLGSWSVKLLKIIWPMKSWITRRRFITCLQGLCTHTSIKQHKNRRPY
jgi:hypothetical protein